MIDSSIFTLRTNRTFLHGEVDTKFISLYLSSHPWQPDRAMHLFSCVRGKLCIFVARMNVRACVCACVCACVRACVRALLFVSRSAHSILLRTKDKRTAKTGNVKMGVWLSLRRDYQPFSANMPRVYCVPSNVVLVAEVVEAAWASELSVSFIHYEALTFHAIHSPSAHFFFFFGFTDTKKRSIVTRYIHAKDLISTSLFMCRYWIIISSCPGSVPMKDSSVREWGQ